MEATFKRKFSAAHRIMGAGICERVHGHNYVAEITVSADDLGQYGMFVVPADDVKEVVDRKYDHRLILASDDPLLVGTPDVAEHLGVVRVQQHPSTENMAQFIADDVCEAAFKYLGGNMNTHLNLVEVEVVLHETETISAKAYAHWSNNP